MTFHNLARMYTYTTGDSDVTLAEAVPGCKTFALAGAVDSGEYSYGLITYDTQTHRPTGSEAGVGKYLSSGPTFQRTTVEDSTDSDDGAITLTGLTQIYLTPVASDFDGFGGSGGGAMFAQFHNPVGADSLSDSDANIVLTVDATQTNPDSIASLSSNNIVIETGFDGYYMFSASVQITAGGAINGKIKLSIWLLGLLEYSNTVYFPSSANVTSLFMNVPANFLSMNSGYDLELQMTNNSGQTLSVLVKSFTVVRLGDSV